MVACIYKIKHHADVDENNIYIGRTLRYTNRKSQHKQDAEWKETKLYNYIRDMGGLNEFVFEIIQEITDRNKDIIKDIEEEYISIFKPQLNSYKNKYGINCDDIKKYNVEYQKIKFTCECGITLSQATKSRHLKTQRHLNKVWEIKNKK